jgi:hypothetical protein
VEDSCDNGNELSASIKDEEFLEQFGFFYRRLWPIGGRLLLTR